MLLVGIIVSSYKCVSETSFAASHHWNTRQGNKTKGVGRFRTGEKKNKKFLKQTQQKASYCTVVDPATKRTEKKS